MEKYSQNDEQFFILSFFKDKPNGKFLDIGAYHTTRFSNVRALYEQLNFKGILVEPSPANFAGIAESYKDDKEITVLNVAIGEFNGDLKFYSSDDAVSTSEKDHMKKWAAAGVKFTEITVPQIRTADFMNQYARDVDFISVDTEATNIWVFRDTPDWVFEQISLYCIEHDGHIEEIENRLNKFGFSTLYTNAENILMGKV